MTTKVHKIFISYHHGETPYEGDKQYRERLEKILSTSGIAINYSVPYNAISSDLMTETVRQKIRDEYLRDATVTLVLIGKDTWKRKHVDWEIGSSIRDTQLNPHAGLLGIILPTYIRTDFTKYNSHTIPPRLYDNIQCGYAKIYNWTDNPISLQNWIHDSFTMRSSTIPNNSRSYFGKNRSGDTWTD
ncbi:MAG: TIR domain-containing protein [Methanoregula sp.]|nr:TIR domain-containing protein [Methanoregula sp.]